MAQRVAVVTGSNKGIGFAIVKELCSKFKGAVYLTARDEARGQAAVNKLKEMGLHPKFHQLDIENEESIINLHDYLKTTYGGLDVLVNNAAIAYTHTAKETMYEQASNTVRVNFFDTLNVCHKLFPLLRPHARVVNISSSSGHLCRINGKEPQASELRKKFASPSLTEEELCALMEQFVNATKAGNHGALGWPNVTYSVSKVGVSALTRIQQRAFDSDSRPDLVVNAVHPGYVITDMTRGKGNLTTEEGAVAPVYLALLPPDIKEPRGGYIWCDTKPMDWESATCASY